METTKKATFTVNELKDSVKSKMEFAGLYAKLASVKTVEYGIKSIIKAEELAKQTVEFSRDKLIELNKFFESRNISKMDLLTIIIEIIIYAVSIMLLTNTGSILFLIIALIDVYCLSYNLTGLFMNIALNRSNRKTVKVQAL